MSREIPDEPYKIDSRFKEIATRPRDYTIKELEEMGFEKSNLDNYILFRQNSDGSEDLSSVFILMEKREDELYRVTPENLRALLDLEGPRDRPVRDPFIESHFYQRFEDERRKEEERRELPPGSLIFRSNSSHTDQSPSHADSS